MPGVQGLTGLTGFVDSAPEATAAQRLGDAADPRHGQISPQDTPYVWEEFGEGLPHGPYGPENQLIGMDIVSVTFDAGTMGDDPTGDLQPLTHAAPWPKGVPQSVGPEAVSERRAESASIHASDMGASRTLVSKPTMYPVQDDWQEVYDVDPGESLLVPVPAQVRGSTGGWGTTDRTQSFQRQNEYGFDSAHQHRRYAGGSIPGNTMWMQPGGRPLVKTIPGTALVPVGNDSPFAGQIPGAAFDSSAGVLQATPTQYQAPPEPALAATVDAGPPGDVAWW